MTVPATKEKGEAVIAATSVPATGGGLHPYAAPRTPQPKPFSHEVDGNIENADKAAEFSQAMIHISPGTLPRGHIAH